MIPEIGHISLIFSLVISFILVIIPAYGIINTQSSYMRSLDVLVPLQFICLVVSFLVLIYSFVTNDFTVSLVANNSNSALPFYYKISATWGNHEGSLLLWTLILSIWTLLVYLKTKDIPEITRSTVLSVLGFIAFGFILFILLTSNPFERQILLPLLDGADLNPLLQDIGLILHPPILYMGYVGFAVAFSFAISALIQGHVDSNWAKWTKTWTNVAWAFLTLGIGLGSWWAYYELGWGGWWFWDPVENASLMPWLAGTALIHSLTVTEKKNLFKNWTILLALIAFSLSLLGTFLVRSGILVSVHAFASDPERGIFILIFMTIVTGGSLLLYAFRGSKLKSSYNNFGLLSRETLLLSNNIILVTALIIVLLGTLFPLISVAIGWGSYSVGPPYFNTMFAPLSIIMIFLMGFAPFFPWGKFANSNYNRNQFYLYIFISYILSFITIFYLSYTYNKEFNFIAFFLCGICLWLLVINLHQFSKLILQKSKIDKSIKFISMLTAHIGIAITGIGITLSSFYSIHNDLRMSSGDSISLNNYKFKIESIELVDGPNFSSKVASINVSKNNNFVDILKPEKRFYTTSQQIMTEAGISANIFRDIYISLGEELEPNSWSISIHIKPFVRLIWLGAILMALGSVLLLYSKKIK